MKLSKKSANDIDIEFSLAQANLFSSIGMLTVNFVSLEFAIIETISILNSSTDVNSTYRLLSGDNCATLIKKLKKIFNYKVLDPILLDDFNNIHKELDSIRIERNKFLHSFLSVDKDGRVSRLKLSSNSKPNSSIVESEILDLNNLENFNQRIINAKLSLKDLNGKLFKIVKRT